MKRDDMPLTRNRPGSIKCLVWDLDDTLWNGILSEGDDVALFEGVAETVRALDARGILQSISSKNDAQPALARLRVLGLEEFFLYPQIHWGPKSDAVRAIAQSLNIGIDAIAFIDDQPFERDEVASQHPQVLCIAVEERGRLLEMDALTPRFITDESSRRRSMYVGDKIRDDAEETFGGAREEFLASLGMVFRITRAEPADLARLEELVARTNQLNTTGRIYSLEQLDAFRTSDRHDLWVASLSDTYGEYGKIGLALVEKDAASWAIKAFLMSCRVMSRGVGSVFIRWLLKRAQVQDVSLHAEMIPNDRNRMMGATYRFAGFKLLRKEGDVELLSHPLEDDLAFPDYVDVRSPG
jgi:FkbH-like protein